MRRPEVLAPAGDEACLKAAVDAGADAVYFGIKGHNARARAANFDTADLPHIMKTLHASGVRGYVPMNILTFDHELDAAAAAIRACDDAGVDALIVQDLGVVSLAREIAPALPVHASTQMTCTDAASVAFAASLGCTRVVLARELSLDDIAAIRAASSIELEVFVHGALCVSYSGQCLTSEAIGGRSANRGACAQACRLPYDLVVDGAVRALGDVAYLLSPQDLAAASVVPRLAEIGVSCLKIEGRLKGPEYVAATTRLYRDAVDRAGGATPPKAIFDLGRAAALTFSRGADTGFLEGTNHQRLVDGETCDHRGLHIGVVASTTTSRGKGLVQVALLHPLKRGDGVLIQGHKAGRGEVGGRVWELFDEALSPIDGAAAAGTTAWLWLGPESTSPGRDVRGVDVGRRVFQTDDSELDKQILAANARTPVKEIVDVTIGGDVGAPFMLHATSRRGLKASVRGDGVVEVARSRPLDKAGLIDKLGRLGDSPYVLGELTVAMPDGITIPVSSLNRARRALTEALDAAATARLPVEHAPASGPALALRAPPPPGLFVLCRTEAQAEVALDAGADGIWLDVLALTGLSQMLPRLRARRAGTFIGAAPPRIRKPGEEKITRFIDGLPIDGILVRGLGHLQELSAAAHDGRLRIGDFSLNVANARTAREVLGRGLDGLVPSYDLDEAQLIALLTDEIASRTELVLHQPMPLFHTEHCVFAALLSEGRDYRSCGRPCERHTISLTDRAGLTHPVEADVGCRNTVFHALPQSAAELVSAAQARGVRRYRIELVRESAAQVSELVAAYRALLDHSASPKATLKRIKTSGGYGVVKGSLRVISDPM